MAVRKGSAIPPGAVEDRVEAILPSDGGEARPARIVVDEFCPWCQDLIAADEDSARVHGVLWHLACYDEVVWEDTR